MPVARLFRRILKGLVSLAFLAVLGFGALVAALWLERRSETTLPAPTGPFAVGRTSEAWVDSATVDVLAPVPKASRELVVWIWFPAAAAQAVPDDYLPARYRAARERSGAGLLRSLFGLLTRDPSKVHAHAASGGDVAPGRPFPVVLLRGGASAPVTNYTTLAEDLASHGYVVVGLDAPYRTSLVVFPDGRVVERTPENDVESAPSDAARVRLANRLLSAWTADMAFALDRLERLSLSDARFGGRLDLARVGAVGHSFGGAQAAQFCREDPRCKAGIDVDGRPLGSVVQEGLRQPFLFLLSDHKGEADPTSRQIQADIQSIYERLPPSARARVVIRGANHFMFSDDAVLKSQLLMRALRAAGVLGIDGRRQLAVAAYCVRSFLDAHLKASDSPPVLSSTLFPEIQVLD